MNNLKFGCLWVGGPLTKIQEISLASFIFYGHEMTLYVYDESIEVPLGVKKAKASDILPESSLFLVENSYACFSDIFRLHMIKKTGLVWVDADTICLSDSWEFKDNIFASHNFMEFPSVVGCVLSLNKDSQILDYLLNEVNLVDKSSVVWAELGGDLLNKAFVNFDYLDYAYEPKLFLGIIYTEWHKMWNPDNLDEILDLYNSSKTIAVYNQMCNRAGIDKNYLPPGSAMEYFYNKFNTKRSSYE